VIAAVFTFTIPSSTGYELLTVCIAFSPNRNLMCAARNNLTQDMSSKFLLPAAGLALLTGSASAQTSINVPSGDQRRLLLEQQKQEQLRQKRLDDAYKAATKELSDQKPNDPWGDIRPAHPTPTVAAPKKRLQWQSVTLL
jgi:hypothetical protein